MDIVFIYNPTADQIELLKHAKDVNKMLLLEQDVSKCTETELKLGKAYPRIQVSESKEHGEGAFEIRKVNDLELFKLLNPKQRSE